MVGEAGLAKSRRLKRSASFRSWLSNKAPNELDAIIVQIQTRKSCLWSFLCVEEHYPKVEALKTL